MIYVDSRQGRRIARSIVSEYFDMEDNHIVHHEDRNATNNDMDNLKVFQCQGDHLRYHRGFRVPILWDGSEMKRKVV